MARVRTRKRGKTYSYIFEAGKKPDGRRKVIEKGGYPSADEAYSAGIMAYTDWKHGNIGITSERMLLADFMPLWLKRVDKDIRESTQASYRKMIRNRITPYLGHIYLQDLKPIEIDTWLQKLYSEGLAKGYMIQVRSILKAALDYAVYPCELISSNPCIYTKVPKNAPVGVVKRVIITPQKYNELMENYPLGHTLHVPACIMYHTGIRISEALGLMWKDIDFNKKTLTICRQLVYTKYGKIRYRITDTKTKQSNRTIYISDELVNELLREKERQQELRIINVMDKEGYCYSFSDILNTKADMSIIDLVCVTDIGKIISHKTVQYELRTHGLNAHSFRHTHATNLAAAGIQPVTVARRLGHSKPDTTLNVYTHDTEEQQKNVVAILEMKKWDTFFST